MYTIQLHPSILFYDIELDNGSFGLKCEYNGLAHLLKHIENN
jgi:hypothetical protein